MKKIILAIAVLATSSVALAEPEVMIIRIGGDAKYTVPKDRVLLIENVYHAKDLELRRQVSRTKAMYFEIEPSFWKESTEDDVHCRFPLKIPAGWTLSTEQKTKPMYLFAVLLEPSELSSYLSKEND